MGDQLMKHVVRDWGDLPGNAYKVLMVMASCAMDDAAPPIYFGGWERLALTGLGRRDWPADADESPEAKKFRESCSEVVRRAISELRGAGAVAVHKRGRPGTRAEYAVTVTQRNVGSAPNKSLGSPQRNVGESDRNVGANYQQSQHSQAEIPTSPTSLSHQSPVAAVDKARSTTGDLERRRRQMDEQGVA